MAKIKDINAAFLATNGPDGPASPVLRMLCPETPIYGAGSRVVVLHMGIFTGNAAAGLNTPGVTKGNGGVFATQLSSVVAESDTLVSVTKCRGAMLIDAVSAEGTENYKGQLNLQVNSGIYNVNQQCALVLSF